MKSLSPPQESVPPESFAQHTAGGCARAVGGALHGRAVDGRVRTVGSAPYKQAADSASSLSCSNGAQLARGALLTQPSEAAAPASVPHATPKPAQKVDILAVPVDVVQAARDAFNGWASGTRIADLVYDSLIDGDRRFNDRSDVRRLRFGDATGARRCRCGSRAICSRWSCTSPSKTVCPSRCSTAATRCTFWPRTRQQQ